MIEGDFYRHITALNQWEPDHFEDWRFDGLRVGRLKQPIADALIKMEALFKREQDGIHLVHESKGLEARTQLLGELITQLHQQGLIERIHGEIYPVTAQHRDQAVATMDRASAPYFGLRAYGQHLNGYVEKPGGPYLWIARRAADRVNFPGKLDNMVAGGLPHGLTLTENLIKECAEEAAVPEQLALDACPVSAITYCCETFKGLKPDTLFCYDLALPEDFTPVNTDGEVAEFMLMPAAEVAEIVAHTDDFKLNCNLVIIDFLIRHGLIEPEHPQYLEITAGLHARL